MQRIIFGDNRVALHFGNQKINLHQSGEELEPKAQNATQGSADLCFSIDAPVEMAVEHLREQGIKIIAGPVLRAGAMGRMESVYCRDPDGNLVEIASYC